MPECIILSGVPCSGKSTWAKLHSDNYIIISCDDIRSSIAGKYKFSNENEKYVWERFYKLIIKRAELNYNMIIDNTNLKPHYIKMISNCLPDNYSVVVKPFHIKLWRAKLRNYLRYIKTGKWIPNKVMNRMYKNYKSIISYYE